MTDRHRGYVVVLEQNVRSDDAQEIINALKMVKGVLTVKPIINDANDEINEARAKYEVRTKVYLALKEL